MEKRLFLAIGLSVMVVWLWSTLAPVPQIPSRDFNNPQTIEKKELTDKSSALTPPSSAPDLLIDQPKITENLNEEKKYLESEKLKAEFSNIGGALNNVVINEYNVSLPITNINGVDGYENALFVLDEVSDNRIRYSYDNNEYRVEKTYVIPEGDYVLDSGIKFYNKTNMSKQISVSSGGYIIEMSRLDKKNEKLSSTKERDKSLFEYAVNLENAVHRKAGAFKFSEKESKRETGQILWTGFRDRYFCALIKPQYETNGYGIDPEGEDRLKITVEAKQLTIPPQGSAELNSVIYIGPEEMSFLKEYGLGFEKIKRYYKFSLFDGIAKIIDSLMHFIYKIIPNWGIAIIIISVVIYFSMYPLTMRGMLSMKKMQSLQPMIMKLKEKHKDNPQKMNKEMMELYKEHKVNPLGGCLPMLLQMPVFIGLYQVLWRSVSFKGAEFLWIKDLSEPDHLFTLPFSLPFLGNEFNLLPVIMVIVMFFQQKISAKNMVISDPAQAAQQKMMTTIMPVFLGFIFYKFASGLTLYFTMFYFFSTFTQWKLSSATKGA